MALKPSHLSSQLGTQCQTDQPQDQHMHFDCQWPAAAVAAAAVYEMSAGKRALILFNMLHLLVTKVTGGSVNIEHPATDNKASSYFMHRRYTLFNMHDEGW